MTREQLFNMIEYADDRFLQRSDKNTVSLEKPNKKNKLLFGMWKMQYVAAAVAIVLLTSITAVAAVTMIRRQAELRQRLGIEGKDVPDYVEFDVSATDVTAPADAENGNVNVTVLSGMRDEQFQRWYFTVGPITEEEAERHVWIVRSDVFGLRSASPMADWNAVKEKHGTTIDEFGNEVADYPSSVYEPVTGAYDEETQTLMLELSVMLNDDFLPEDRTNPIECTVFSMDALVEDETVFATWVEDAEFDEGGYFALDIEKAISIAKYKASMSLTPTMTDVESKTVVFGDGVVFANPDTGAQGKMTEIEIFASGHVRIHYTIPEDAETMNRFFNEGASLTNEEYLDLQENVFIPWSNAADAVMLDMTINFKDGTSAGGYVSGRLTYKNGVLEAEGMSDKPIALSEIESVTIGGQTFPAQ